jgi:hypothetical protein
MTVDASTITSFRQGWHRLAGHRGLVKELLPTGEVT